MINILVYLHVLQVMEDGEVSVRTVGSAVRTVKQSEEDESQEERKDQGHFPRWVLQPQSHHCCLILTRHFLLTLSLTLSF